MKYAVFGLVLTGLAVSVPAHANEAMAKKYNCLACHTVDKRSVGPAYKDVAKKYAGQAGAEAKLADKIKKGGAGVWGPTPMPPNAAVPDADIKALAKWVLSLK
jgi:cytochrome c